MRDVSTQVGRVIERERIMAQVGETIWGEQQDLIHTLHDVLGQQLTGLGMLAASLRHRLSSTDQESAQTARQIAGAAQEALDRVRQLSKGLFPVDIDGEGFVEALRRLATTTELLHKIPCSVDCDTPIAIPNSRVATQLFRIAQEAITNALRHAEADHITIRLRTEAGSTSLLVIDGGVGIHNRVLQRRWHRSANHATPRDVDWRRLLGRPWGRQRHGRQLHALVPVKAGRIGPQGMQTAECAKTAETECPGYLAISARSAVAVITGGRYLEHMPRRIGEGVAMTSEPARARRVLIVDDHAIVRLGIRQLLATEPGLAICAEAETAEQALDLALIEKPDLAIVDLSLGTMHGLELVRQLHEAFPEMPVLVLSMHDEVLFAERALRAGARGYITKKGAIDGLIHAIRQVLAGKIYASEDVSQGLLAGLGRSPSPGSPLGGLTDRELEVFELIGRGVSTATIAEQLRVSVKTIESHRSNIKSKLKLKGAKDLLRLAASWTDRL